MLVAYLAGPYRSADGVNGVHQNIEAARAVAVELWRFGFAVVCPHMNTAYMDGACGQDDGNVWLRGDLAILERCDIVVMLPGWENSKGANGELCHAEKRGIPVYHWPKDVATLVGLGVR